MCGIAGTVGPKHLDAERARAALAAMAHRGPDGEGAHQGRAGSNAVTLLHRRLAIIDPEPRSGQPMSCEGLTITFNGELYNYVELRAELESLGHGFVSGGDTEVLLRAWREWGPRALERMEGMWAFAIADESAGKVYLCRDRFGEKPLLTAEDGDVFCFASEPRALAALLGRRLRPDLRHARRMLVHNFRAHFKTPETYFEGVKEIPAATLTVIDADGRREDTVYWSPAFQPRPMSREDAEEGVRERLIEAVRLRLRADVPYAFCLSGGVDSNVMAGIAAKHFNQDIKTYSIIDSDPKHDESEFIEVSVNDWGVSNQRHHLDKSDFLDRIRRLTLHRCEPVLTLTSFIHSYLVDAIAADGFKVALSGVGADEIFTGYYDYYNFWLADQRGAPNYPALLEDWRRGFGAFVRNPVLQDPEVFVKNPDTKDYHAPHTRKFAAFLTEPDVFEEPEKRLSENPLRNRMLNDMMYENLPVMLRNEDFNSMMVSVENRAPYLDRRLTEFVLSTPNEHLIHDGYPKWLLRAAGAGFAPEKVLFNREKRAFDASIDSLLDRRSADVRERLLGESPVFDLIRRECVEDMLNLENIDGSEKKFLFGFITVKMFLDSFNSADAFDAPADKTA